MRVVIITIIILTVFVVGTVVLNHYVNVSSKKLLDEVEELHVLVEKNKWPDSKKQFAGLKEGWESTKKRWQFFLGHHEMDTIDIVLSRLEQYLEVKDKALVLGQTAELRLLIDHIKGKEGFMPGNIL